MKTDIMTNGRKDLSMYSRETSELSRRSLLIGLASAPAIGAGASYAVTLPGENPVLLRLAAELTALDAEHREALADERRIYLEAMKIWPCAPDEIKTTEGFGSDLERDIAGAGISSPQSKSIYRFIGTPARFRELQDLYKSYIDHPKRSKWREKCKPKWRAYLAENERNERISKQYHADVERVRQGSGFNAAKERRVAAQNALKGHVTAIMDTPEHTVTGVIIKAEALTAWGAVDRFSRELSIEATPWPQQMAEAVLRQMNSTAA